MHSDLFPEWVRAPPSFPPLFLPHNATEKKWITEGVSVLWSIVSTRFARRGGTDEMTTATQLGGIQIGRLPANNDRCPLLHPLNGVRI